MGFHVGCPKHCLPKDTIGLLLLRELPFSFFQKPGLCALKAMPPEGADHGAEAQRREKSGLTSWEQSWDLNHGFQIPESDAVYRTSELPKDFRRTSWGGENNF